MCLGISTDKAMKTRNITKGVSQCIFIIPPSIVSLNEIKTTLQQGQNFYDKCIQLEKQIHTMS